MANNGNGEHPISGLMNVTLEKIRQMVDSNTIIGNPINTADGTTILPVSKVSFGFVSGGSDFVSSKAPKDLFGGGSGSGVSIVPVAFLVIKEGSVRLIQLADKSSTIDRALNMLPEVMDKVQGLVANAGKGEGKDKKAAKKGDAAEAGEDSPPEVEVSIEFEEADEGVVVEPFY